MSGSWKSARSTTAVALAALVLALVPAAAPAAGPGEYDHQRCGNTSPRVLLTLDDWPEGNDDRTVEVGAYLQRRGVRGAFFLINQYASQQPRIAETLRRQGHWVGNHTYSHPHLRRLSEQDARTEIRRGLSSTLLRPPYGDFGDRETRIAAELGYRICTWTVDTLDWERTGDGYRSPEAIRASVRNAPAADKRGGVVLGHLFSRFPDALPGLIDDLKGQGYGLCRNTGPTQRVIPYPLGC
ncbi:polysaccharide deacetylase family protein [Streptomyces sp. ISL-11]|uniref:polysaccharide deacetylase family protein n=1 Tax=Streptomyces sp. ISL-11 TaxID=2819174 RepID=UPI001BEA3B87|nr:polysaccharide deacetylase family protein [Streptomyces sp. ISL-11]MBT2386052.1 polysaccharide deacetylase family protein [Streptomyces sp. ISL-11]